jgi:hypothetical protein
MQRIEMPKMIEGVAEKKLIAGCSKRLRGEARSFRGSCSWFVFEKTSTSTKNEHDFREAIERNEAYEFFSADR